MTRYALEDAVRSGIAKRDYIIVQLKQKELDNLKAFYEEQRENIRKIDTETLVSENYQDIAIANELKKKYEAAEEIWDQKLSLFEGYVGELEEELLDRHENEILQKLKDFKLVLPREVHTNSDCAKWRRLEQLAIKKKDYLEAEVCRQKASTIEEILSNRLGVKGVEVIDSALQEIRTRQKRQLTSLRQRAALRRAELRRDRERHLQRVREKIRFHKYDSYHPFRNEEFNPQEFIRNLSSGSLRLQADGSKSPTAQRVVQTERSSHKLQTPNGERKYRESSPGSNPYDRHLRNLVETSDAKKNFLNQLDSGIKPPRDNTSSGKRQPRANNHTTFQDGESFDYPKELKSSHSDKTKTNNLDNSSAKHNPKLSSTLPASYQVSNQPDEVINYTKPSPSTSNFRQEDFVQGKPHAISHASHQRNTPKKLREMSHTDPDPSFTSAERNKSNSKSGTDHHSALKRLQNSKSPSNLRWKDAIFVIPKGEQPSYLGKHSSPGQGPSFDPCYSNKKRISSRSLAKRSISRSKSRSKSRETSPNKSPQRYLNHPDFNRVHVDKKDLSSSRRANQVPVDAIVPSERIDRRIGSGSPYVPPIRGMSSEKENVHIQRKQPSHQSSARNRSPIIATLPSSSAVQSIDFSESPEPNQKRAIVNTDSINNETPRSEERKPITEAHLKDHPHSLVHNQPQTISPVHEIRPDREVQTYDDYGWFDNVNYQSGKSSKQSMPHTQKDPKSVSKDVSSHSSNKGAKTTDGLQREEPNVNTRHNASNAVEPDRASQKSSKSKSNKVEEYFVTEVDPSKPVFLKKQTEGTHVSPDFIKQLSEEHVKNVKEFEKRLSQMSAENTPFINPTDIEKTMKEIPVPSLLNMRKADISSEEIAADEINSITNEQLNSRAKSRSSIPNPDSKVNHDEILNTIPTGINIYRKADISSEEILPEGLDNKSRRSQEVANDGRSQNRLSVKASSKRPSNASSGIVNPKVPQEEIEKGLSNVPQNTLFLLRKASITSEELQPEQVQSVRTSKAPSKRSSHHTADGAIVNPNVSKEEIERGLQAIPKDNLFVIRKADISSEEMMDDAEHEWQSSNNQSRRDQLDNKPAASKVYKEDLDPRNSSSNQRRSAHLSEKAREADYGGRHQTDREEFTAHPTVPGRDRQTEKVFIPADSTMPKPKDQGAMSNKALSSGSRKVNPDEVNKIINNIGNTNPFAIRKCDVSSEDMGGDDISVHSSQPMKKKTEASMVNGGFDDTKSARGVSAEVPNSKKEHAAIIDTLPEVPPEDVENTLKALPLAAGRVLVKKASVSSEELLNEASVHSKQSKSMGKHDALESPARSQRMSKASSKDGPYIPPQETDKIISTLPSGGLLNTRKCDVSSEEMQPEDTKSARSQKGKANLLPADQNQKKPSNASSRQAVVEPPKVDQAEIERTLQHLPKNSLLTQRKCDISSEDIFEDKDSIAEVKDEHSMNRRSSNKSQPNVEYMEDMKVMSPNKSQPLAPAQPRSMKETINNHPTIAAKDSKESLSPIYSRDNSKSRISHGSQDINLPNKKLPQSSFKDGPSSSQRKKMSVKFAKEESEPHSVTNYYSHRTDQSDKKVADPSRITVMELHEHSTSIVRSNAHGNSKTIETSAVYADAKGNSVSVKKTETIKETY